MLRIVVLSSCTGKKSVRHPHALTMQDFQRGPQWVAQRESEFQGALRPAEELYRGAHHVRLMRGVRKLRATGNAAVDVFIVSAGYGLVPGDRLLAPYEATFNGMGLKALRAWANALSIPDAAQAVLAQPYDLALLLLGQTYLRACSLDEDVRLGGPAIALYGAKTAALLPGLDGLHPFALLPGDTARFHCGQVGLKGEIAGRLLEHIAVDVGVVPRLQKPGCDLRLLLA